MRGYEQYTYYLQLSAERTGRGGRGGPARPQRLEVRREAPTSYRVFTHHRMSQVGRPPLLLSQQQAVSRPSALAHYDFVRGRCVPCALLVLSRASGAARGALWTSLPRRIASFFEFYDISIVLLDPRPRGRWPCSVRRRPRSTYAVVRLCAASARLHPLAAFVFAYVLKFQCDRGCETRIGAVSVCARNPNFCDLARRSGAASPRSICAIHVKDFLAHKDFKFRPSARLNIVIGPSGSGKVRGAQCGL